MIKIRFELSNFKKPYLYHQSNRRPQFFNIYRKMNIVEWGSEFPVSGNIQQILYSFTHKFKKLRTFIRALHSICFLYEDSTIIILPVAVLQTKASLQTIQQFLDTKKDPPSSILYYENKIPVVDVISLSPQSDVILPDFLIYKENFTFDLIRTQNDKSIQLKLNEPMTIHDSFLKRVSINNGFISIVTQRENESKYTIYSAQYSTNHQVSAWALQCVVDFVPSLIFTRQPTLYVYQQSDSGIFGCSLDSKGYRRFPRPLTLVCQNDDFIPVHSLIGFYIFDKTNSTILQISGKNTKKVCSLNSGKILEICLLGSRVFALTQNSIVTHDILTGEAIHTMSVPNTESWKISLDESYGIVFCGAKNYTVSKTEIPPLINLYAEKSELMNQMMKVNQTVGTVAAPILLLSNRSPYLATTLLSEEINNEVQKSYTETSIQGQVRPTLEKLNELLKHKPE
ncbi:hypothetical protein TRFO_05680 [Tritrichomonas foetus]|uniref:Uncharacterized protein n=1 Tax=Tritrichomonas foetus TaxID=1144522 RepID=A0A1J4K3T5_9EUKA|nr:hypothetical protein TRFO_05680 [Tritrichomonas foetus]|eukprot:OHT06039.1 hypothetical protein TRFO_05680 [Tritrichomonas foetus]